MRLCKYAQTVISRNRQTDERTGEIRESEAKETLAMEADYPDVEWRRQYSTAHMRFFSFFFVSPTKLI